MARSLTCDRCGKQTTRIVMKLFLSPVNANGSMDRNRSTHSNYTGHVDIGECCAAVVTQEFKWQKRRSMPRRTNAA